MSRRVSLADRLLLGAGGLGLVPVAPGTIGSLGTVLLIWLPHRYLGLDGRLLAIGLLAYGVIVTLLRAHVVVGADQTGDPGWVVADEVAGQALALLPILLGFGPRFGPAWMPWVLGFVLFRLFDILKPGPVGWAERQHGAVGILLDDLVAGGIAAILLTGLGALA